MTTTRLLTLLLCGCLLSVQTTRADEDKNAWREKVDTAIAGGIKLLEAKDYAGFLKAFVEPEMMEKFSKDGSIDEFAKMFGEKKGPQLLEVLKKIKYMKPTMEQDGKVASFDVEIEGTSKKGIKFRKIEKYWYIIN
jgi:hypothetical protein